MDFGLTEAQAELAGLTRKILAERDAPWGDLAAAGVLAAGLPASLGGAGLGLLEQCSVLIELGRAASDVPYLASIVLGAGALAEFGTAAQREQWAAAAGRGSVVLTAALAEEDGDDPRRPSARAERADGRWVLSGVKTAVDAAPRGGPVPGALRHAGRGAGVPGRAVRRRGERGAAAADGLRLGGPGGARGRASWATTGCSPEMGRVRRSRTGWWRGPRWGCARCSPG